jgi:SAM-dependent methyltransferase
MTKLNLGCGKDRIEGYINCDISKEVNPDKIVDLEKKLPFKDNSIDEIITYHTLEHIKNFIPLMEEIYRILKNDGILKVRAPYFAYPGAFQDPTHVRFFTLRTFDCFSKDNGLNYYSNARFEIVYRKLKFSIKRDHLLIDFLINKFQRVYERLFSRIFPCAELIVILKAKK